MQSMYVVENENEDVVDKFTQKVKKLKPEFKSGLGRQMFIENQIAYVT